MVTPDNVHECWFSLEQLMVVEKKLLVELDETKAQVRKMQEARKEDRRRPADEEALRKIKKLEDANTDLQKTISNQKQVR